jgi:hypothetical protein
MPLGLIIAHDFPVELQGEKTTGLRPVSRGVITHDLLTQKHY